MGDVNLSPSQSNWEREEFLQRFIHQGIKPGDGIDANQWMDKMRQDGLMGKSSVKDGQGTAGPSSYQKPTRKLADVVQSRSQSNWEREEFLQRFIHQGIKPGDGIDANQWMDKMSRARNCR